MIEKVVQTNTILETVKAELVIEVKDELHGSHRTLGYLKVECEIQNVEKTEKFFNKDY